MERLSIARCVSGGALPCGCIAGVYLTRAGRTLTVIDEPADHCRDRSHQADFVLEGPGSACPAELRDVKAGDAISTYDMTMFQWKGGRN
jgi:hypothetical protein